MKKFVLSALIWSCVLVVAACAGQEKGPLKQTKYPSQDFRLMAQHEVYFDVDSDILDPEALLTVREAAQGIARKKAKRVVVTGFADKSGNQKYNIALSKKRAASTIRALCSEGVRRGLIERKAKGEDDPAYSTPDGIKFKENRRVLIEVYG